MLSLFQISDVTSAEGVVFFSVKSEGVYIFLSFNSSMRFIDSREVLNNLSTKLIKSSPFFRNSVSLLNIDDMQPKQ